MYIYTHIARKKRWHDVTFNDILLDHLCQAAPESACYMVPLVGLHPGILLIPLFHNRAHFVACAYKDVTTRVSAEKFGPTWHRWWLNPNPLWHGQVMTSMCTDGHFVANRRLRSMSTALKWSYVRYSRPSKACVSGHDSVSVRLVYPRQKLTEDISREETQT